MSLDENTGRIEIRDAEDDDVRAVRRVAQTTWEQTYGDSIPEHVRAGFLGEAYSADALRHRIASNAFLEAISQIPQ